MSKIGDQITIQVEQKSVHRNKYYLTAPPYTNLATIIHPYCAYR